jgi:hypothetical protein
MLGCWQTTESAAPPNRGWSARLTSWRQRVLDLWEEVSHLPRSQYIWYAIGLVIAVWALSTSLAKIGMGGLLFLIVAALLVYRHIRNRPVRVQEMLVRRISKLPEVRLITLQKRQFNVWSTVPLPSSTTINGLLQSANRELYHEAADSLGLARPDDEQLRQMLTSPGGITRETRKSHRHQDRGQG